MLHVKSATLQHEQATVQGDMVKCVSTRGRKKHNTLESVFVALKSKKTGSDLAFSYVPSLY